MAQVNQSMTEEPAYWTDSWDGYPQARQRFLDHLVRARTPNPLVIGGDVHCHWVCDVKSDFDRPKSATVASEFCGTSISSQGWPQARVLRMLPQNPHAKFASAERRGYVVMALSKARCEVALRGVEDEKRRDTPIETQARFVVEDGRPGPQRD